ncbi:hypothetical protein [Streptomyces sp. NPDC001139]
MADRSQHHPQKHDPRTWDDDDNKPVIPKIPGPRAPRTTAEDHYTFAAAVADCPVHRPMHEEAEARYAAHGESFQRVQRRTLGMPFRRSAVAA